MQVTSGPCFLSEIPSDVNAREDTPALGVTVAPTAGICALGISPEPEAPTIKKRLDRAIEHHGVHG